MDRTLLQEVWVQDLADHCVVFLNQTVYSLGASLYSGVEMGTRKLSGKPDEMPGGGGGGVTL